MHDVGNARFLWVLALFSTGGSKNATRKERSVAHPDKRAVQVRLSGDDLARLDAWRRAQDQILPSSEALRQLLRKALRDVALRRPRQSQRVEVA